MDNNRWWFIKNKLFNNKDPFMVTKRTINQIELFDDRLNSIGFHTIYLKVEGITFNESAVASNGYYYYYIGESVKLLSKFVRNYDWDTVASVEVMLDPINTTSVRTALIQRVAEFTHIQLIQEDGQNFGTSANDWELV